MLILLLLLSSNRARAATALLFCGKFATTLLLFLLSVMKGATGPYSTDMKLMALLLLSTMLDAALLRPEPISTPAVNVSVQLVAGLTKLLIIESCVQPVT